jgi:tripartite-type tricarboxylate transporter receptor subunit TctC
MNAATANPTVKERLSALGVDPMPMTSEEFGKFIAGETEKWGKVVQTASITAE